MLNGSRPKYSKLQLSGIEIPAGADSEISMSINLISSAADMQRTVNGDLLNVARSVFRKYAVSLSGSGMRPAGLAGLAPGDYVELISFEEMPISARPAAATVELPRAGVDVVGITADGRAIAPISQPASPLPLEVERGSTRIAELRMRPSVEFAEPVSLVRYHAALACAVIEWGIDNDERMATSSWSLQLEEV